MRKTICLLLLLLACGSSIEAGGFIRLAGEVMVPLPDDWLPGTDTLEYPFQMVYSEDAAEILVFRSEISARESVTDQEALKKTVDEIINDVILALPDARLLTSTGYYDTYRTGFLLEFLSSDTVNDVETRHRLKGILYRHPDGHQLLFTVWAKALNQLYPDVENALKLVQDGFAYHGPYEADVFGSKQSSLWPAILAALITLVVLSYFRMRRRYRRLPAHVHSTNFWHCECGRLNHISNDTCRRCGRRRTSNKTV